MIDDKWDFKFQQPPKESLWDRNRAANETKQTQPNPNSFDKEDGVHQLNI